MQNQHPQNLFYWYISLEWPWGRRFMMYSTLEPSFHPLFYKRKIYGLFHQRAAKYCYLRQAAAKRGENKLNENKSSISKPNALQVKFSFAQLFILVIVHTCPFHTHPFHTRPFAQLTLFILFLILCPTHWCWQLVMWKFINLFTNTLWYPAQRGQKRGYFRGGRVF